MYPMSRMPEVGHYQLQNGCYLGTQHHDHDAYFFHSECMPTSGVNSMPHSNILRRPNMYPSRFCLDVLNYRGSIAVSTNHHNLHPLYSDASNQPLRDYAQVGLYNSFPSRHVQMDNARLPCKRRSPDSMILDHHSSSGYYGVATSSDFPNLSGYLYHPISHYRHWDPIGTVYGYRMNTNSDVGQRSVRNVRRRIDNRPELDICPPINHSPSIFRRHNRFVEIAPDPSMGQWNSTYGSTPPDRSVLSSGMSFRYDINQSFQRGGQISGGMVLDHDFNFFSTRNVLTTLSSHGPVRHRGFDLNTYDQRATSHTTASNYVPRLGLSSTFHDRSSRLDFIAYSRFSRPSLSMAEHGIIERSALDMNMYNRQFTFTSENNTHRRLVHRDLPTMDQLPAYFESRQMFDEHWDMRLDIDNMGYEELLALGESIGSVNIGLSEDSISSFLLEMVYLSSDEDEDGHEETCPICLEEYKDKDNLGRLKCRHFFHFCCIKEWLLIKKDCPLCKAPAGTDNSK